MSPRAGLGADSVVRAAARLADSEGLDALTLTRLAAELGVRPPSLYAHIGGVGDLRRRVAAHGARELAAELRRAVAGRAGGEALSAVAAAYRSYALAHPGTYVALQRAPDVDAHEAGAEPVEVVLAILRGYGLSSDAALHAARAIRSALHGFVMLETSEGFGYPLAIDESYRRLVLILDRGLARR